MKARLTAPGALGLLAAAAISAAGVAGCGPGFEPPNRLNSPRVLAIKSDPVAPAFGDTTMLSAETYTPNGVPLFYDWSWCPVALAPGIPCSVTDEQVSQLVGMPVSLHLGSDATVPFVHNIPVDKLALFCGPTSPLPPIDCTDGYPIQLRLVVCTESDPNLCQDVTHSVEAVRPMRLRFRPDDQANANPTITGLHALLMDGMDPADVTNALSPPTLTRHKETVITADIHPDADAETYQGLDDESMPATVSERLTLSWFVESGDTNHLRTSYIRGTTATGDVSDRIKWTPAFLKDEKDSLRDDKTLSRVIVVIRDNRDGVAWIEGSARLVEETTP
jgi:hypothetical protein